MIKSWISFAIMVAALLFGFIWTTYQPEAPYKIFSEILWLSFSVYITKRVVQRARMFTNNEQIVHDKKGGHRED